MTQSTLERDIQRGYGSAERPLTKDLLAMDSLPHAPALRETGNFEPDHVNVDYRRYYDPQYARLELDKVFMRTWLFACREEDIPQVGDRVPFDVGPLSFFVVRSKPDEFRAFYNSCLHRGTLLCTGRSSGSAIRCPYHGWEWKIDGSLSRIPSHWDFRSVKPGNAALRQLRLGRWGGFIFVSADSDGPPLEQALGVIPRHFDGYQIEERYTAARFRKLVPANWKVAQEAFQESYHLFATHPEAVPFNGDTQTQNDIWDSEHSHIARGITPSATPSMHAGADATSLEAARVYASILTQWHYPGAEAPKLDPAGNLRRQLADWHRSVQLAYYNKMVEEPDAVMLDSIVYYMFPNLVLWLSESLPFVYQFTPHPTDPERSFFDVRMLLPCPVGKPRPPAAAAVEIGIDEKIADNAPAFGFLAHVYDQDMANLPLVQRGLRSADPKRHHSHLGTYQEIILQYWHQLFDRYLSR